MRRAFCQPSCVAKNAVTKRFVRVLTDSDPNYLLRSRRLSELDMETGAKLK